MFLFDDEARCESQRLMLARLSAFRLPNSELSLDTIAASGYLTSRFHDEAGQFQLHSHFYLEAWGACLVGLPGQMLSEFAMSSTPV